VEPDQLTYTQTSYLPGSECFFLAGDGFIGAHLRQAHRARARNLMRVSLSGPDRNAREILFGRAGTRSGAFRLYILRSGTLRINQMRTPLGIGAG
jgi:hypothetical protein